ncbi:MAG: lysophospholipid acyltransferase family protein [Planctomycetaceae bacterium]|nr:lysophospholipid acyltransferase family protein [Planctomycetaceae bacterium]
MNDGALWEHSRHWLNIRPIYAFGEWVLDSMPLFVGYGITWGVTEVAYHFSPDQRAGIEANLRQVFRHLEPSLSEPERQKKIHKLVYKIFHNRGVWFADLSVLAGRRQVSGLFNFERSGNWKALEKQLATGKGAIVASAHLGNWHGGGFAMARTGVPVRVVMYRNHAGDMMDRKVARRARVQQTYIDSDPMAMMEIMKALNSGEVLAMLVDKPWDSRSMSVPFFGKPSRFPLGPIRLARLGGVPIFPAFCVWKRPREYEAILCDPIEVRGRDPEEAEHGALCAIAKVIEQQVSANLPVWFNFTPVWDPA